MSFGDDVISSSTIYQTIASYLGSTDFSLVYNGRTLPQEESVPQDANVLVTFSLPGGKGGFGSMLRAIGAQIEKTTNREACRDLSGRRLRDINEEQRLKKWISKESEREADKARRRKERIERLKAKPKHHFNDFEYEQKLNEAPDRVEEALTAGMEKRSKRPASAATASCSAVPPKKKRLWLDEDISCSSDSDPEAEDSPSTSDSCTATPAGEAGCSSFPDEHTGPQDSGDSSDAKTLVEKSPSQEESTRESKEQYPVESKDMSAAESNDVVEDTPNPVEILLSTENDSSSSDREKSGKDLSSDDCLPAIKTTNEVDTSPVDLMSFEGPTSLEALGLDRLKLALIERGLKCGGTARDRAQRLWSVRGLQPHQYPTNLVAKKKK